MGGRQCCLPRGKGQPGDRSDGFPGRLSPWAKVMRAVFGMPLIMLNDAFLRSTIETSP